MQMTSVFRTVSARSEDDVRATRVARWLEPQEIALDVALRDRKHALEHAASTFARARALDPAPIIRALWRRELVGSTALGAGVAIPHARIEGIENPCLMFTRAKCAIDFAAPDAKPVRHVLTILVPAAGDPEDHLQLLAHVAQMFSDETFRLCLSSTSDVTEVRDAFARCAKRAA